MIKRKISETLNRSITTYCDLLDDSCIIAGGFIRSFYSGEPIADMDLYFETEEAHDAFKKKIDESEDWKEVFKTDLAVSYRKGRKKVQLIKVFFQAPEELINRFDFTICSAALQAGTEYIYDTFFEHLAGKLLIYKGVGFSLSSLKRTYKYVKRGYSICDENIIKIAESIHREILDNDENMEEMIQGLDPDGDRRIRVID